MKASDLFKSRGKPAPSLPVKFKLVSLVDGQQTVLEAEAVFRFVPDRLKTEAEGDAEKALSVLAGKGTPITEEIRVAYRQAHLLHAILRDKDEPGAVFFDGAGADEAREKLMQSERMRLLALYQGWIEKEFPGVTDDPKFKEAMADAGNFTVRALLTKYGFDITRLCVISLALTPTTPPTT